MKKFVALLLAAVLACSLTAALAEGALVVYSPHDADPLQAGLAMSQEAYPDIKVEYIAAGTGELLQRAENVPLRAFFANLNIDEFAHRAANRADMLP